jgi:hypothetical protein
MTEATVSSRPQAKQSRFMRKALPYFLSMPALLMCIGILIPFLTAVYYSMLRFRLNLPQMKGFIWFQNYVGFFTDVKFWNTVYISLTYAFLTVAAEANQIQQHGFDPALASFDDGTRSGVSHVEADDQSKFRNPELSRWPSRLYRFQMGVGSVIGIIHRGSG